MRTLLGRLLLVTLATLGIWYVVAQYQGHTTFGCPHAAAMAHADTTPCPANIDAAMVDPEWAAGRIASLPRTGSTTTGLFYDQDGHETRFASRQDDTSNAALTIGRDAGIFPIKGRPDIIDHVEVKAAATMRFGDVQSGVLVINFPGPPCGELPGGATQPLSCAAVVPRMLPPGTTLVIWWQQAGSHRPRSTTFTGRRP